MAVDTDALLISPDFRLRAVPQVTSCSDAERRRLFHTALLAAVQLTGLISACLHRTFTAHAHPLNECRGLRTDSSPIY